MARLTNKGQLSGGAGPVSWFSLNGITYMRSKPGKGNTHQSEATRKTASDFGRASSLARVMRQALRPLLQGREEPAFHRRFASAVYQAARSANPNSVGNQQLYEGDPSLLSGLDCSLPGAFVKHCGLVPEISLSEDTRITISIPAFSAPEHIRQFPDASEATLALLITAVDPDTRLIHASTLQECNFELTDQQVPAVSFSGEVLPAHSIYMVAVSLRYLNRDHLGGVRETASFSKLLMAGRI